MRPIRALILAATLSASAAMPLLAADPPATQPVPGAAEVPVTKAVLFSSGVGYFEHDGTVHGDGDIRLQFTTDQINDVLKSLVVLDSQGGTGSSVTYASNDPLTRALKSFGIDLSDSPALWQLLGRLRGAKLIVHAPDPVEGVILGVEARTKVVGQPPATVTEYVLTIVSSSGGSIRSIPLASVDSIQLADPKLQEELTKALALVAASRDTNRKVVDVHLSGKGDRSVSLAYLVQTPVWKTSYRLDLSNADKPLIQGWAIVENTSDTDWKNVKLSLVAGRPISFVEDLYTPLYLDRPVVQPELYASLRPRMHEEGEEFRKDEQKAQNGIRDRRVYNGQAPASPTTQPMAMAGLVKGDTTINGVDDALMTWGQMPVAARGGSVGELFEYTINQPVDLPRRQSAMLPIVNQKITAEKVSIYNQSVDPANPLNGVWLTNDTGNKLPAGPVTVFDGNNKTGLAYAGDAQIGHMGLDDKRLISYAIDLAVTVDPSVTSQSQITSAKIVHGVLMVTNRESFSQIYAIKNKAQAKRKLIVEHPFIDGRILVQPTKFEEKTPAVYRFAVQVDAGETVKFEVKEDQPVTQNIAILPQATDTLVWYASRGSVIPKSVRDALAKAVAFKNDLADAENQLAEANRQMAEIKGGQERLRENIKTVTLDSPLGKRYQQKLNSQEDQIDKLDGQITELKKSVDARRADLAGYLNDLNVE